MNLVVPDLTISLLIVACAWEYTRSVIPEWTNWSDTLLSIVRNNLGRSSSVSSGIEALEPKDLAAISRKRLSITFKLAGNSIADLYKYTTDETKPSVFITVRRPLGVLR